MRTVLNYRPIFLSLIGILLGIFAYTYYFLSSSGLWMAIVISAIIGSIAVVAALGWLIKPSNKKIIISLRACKRHIVWILIFFIVGMGAIGVQHLFHNSQQDFSGEFRIVADINDGYFTRGGSTFVTLSNATVHLEDGSTHRLPGRIDLVVFIDGLIAPNRINATNSIEFTANLERIPFSNDNFSFSKLANGITYRASIVAAEGFTFWHSGRTLGEVVRAQYRTALELNMPPEFAELSFSLLFGRSGNLSISTNDLFSAAGVGHLLSVSGLHVGLLATVLFLILKLFKTKRWVNFAITAIVLLLYCYLCGFSAPVVRATIMTLAVLLSVVVGKKSDKLNAISLAAIIILLYNPVSLFTLGFQLSFISVFTIIFILPMLSTLKIKNRALKNLANTIIMTAIISATSTFIMAYVFQQVPIYSILSNVLAVPLVSLAYMLVFMFSTVAVILPFLGFLLAFPAVLLHMSRLILGVIGGMPASLVQMWSNGYIATLLVLLAFFIFRYLLVGKKLKISLMTAIILVVITATVIVNIPANFNSYNLIIANQRESNTSLLTTADNQRILIGTGFFRNDDLVNLRHASRINHINTVIAYDFNHRFLESLLTVSARFNVETVIVVTTNPDMENYLTSIFYFTNVKIINHENIFTVDTIEFRAHIVGGEAVGITATINSSNLLFLRRGILVDQIRQITRDYYGIFYNFVITSGFWRDLTLYNVNLGTLINTGPNNQPYYIVYNLRELNSIRVLL